MTEHDRKFLYHLISTLKFQAENSPEKIRCAQIAFHDKCAQILIPNKPVEKESDE